MPEDQCPGCGEMDDDRVEKLYVRRTVEGSRTGGRGPGSEYISVDGIRHCKSCGAVWGIGYGDHGGHVYAQ